MTALDQIAANAAHLAFPTEAMRALTRLDVPDDKGEE